MSTIRSLHILLFVQATLCACTTPARPLAPDAGTPAVDATTFESLPPVETSTQMPTGWLRAAGNHLYAADGRIWHGRGASVFDTRSCNSCTFATPNVVEVNRRTDELVDNWRANFVRLALESYGTSGGRTQWKTILDDPQYLVDIQGIVDHVGSKPGVYVMLSLWTDPTVNDMKCPTAETNKVWEKLAATFRNSPHVIFGVINEPEYNFGGERDAECWTAFNSTVQAIRNVETAYGSPRHIISVQGTGGWARRLDYYVTHPIEAGGGENIAYEVHVYDPASEFDKLFVNAAKTLPVIIGEFGPTDAPTLMTMADCTALMDQAESLEIPYMGWAFHMRCPPSMLVDNSGGRCGLDMKLEATEWGQLIKSRFAKPW